LTHTENIEIRLAADEMIARFGGDRAAIEAASWANEAHHRGDTAKYEFWQWVAMDINERNLQKWQTKKAKN
jgi:hypothetical protein